MCISGIELFVALITLVVSLFFNVEIGLLAGVCVNIIYLALMWSRPKLKIEMIKVSIKYMLNMHEVIKLYNIISLHKLHINIMTILHVDFMKTLFCNNIYIN